MIAKFNRNKQRKKRHRRIRNNVVGVPSKPRLNVFRSNTNMYLQLIDDINGETIASASTMELDSEGTKTDQAAEVGKLIADRAKEEGIEEVVFDRGGYQYHGRVKAVADAARENGLKF